MVLGLLALLLAVPAGPAPAVEPVVEKYLLEGKLAEGEKALLAKMQKNTDDDELRFGLGWIYFLQTFEHLGANLYKYGLRTERAFVQPVPQIRQLLPQNPNPEKLTYPAARQILQTWIDDLNKAETTLAQVKDPKVKLSLHVGLIKIDPFGQNKPVSAAFLFRQGAGPAPPGGVEAVEKFVIGFDRGDVSWLRGYCHFLAAWGELLLAVDGQELFDCTAHLLFEKVDSPYTFLQEEPRKLDEQRWVNVPLFSDIIALIHLTRLPIKDPARPKKALEHLEAMVAMAKEMWKYILAETDDDNEWIPNPRQKGVVGVAVTQEMVDTWLATVDEAEQILKGKKLLPFWRGTPGDRGVNLRRVFTEPRTFDPFLWVQGTAAGPYLEKGEITKFTNPQMLNRINGAFGGFGFIGFAFWFN